MKKVYFLVAVGLVGGLALVVWIIRALGPTPEETFALDAINNHKELIAHDAHVESVTIAEEGMGDDHDDHDGERRDDHEGDHEGGPRKPRPEGGGDQAQSNQGGDAQAQAGPGAPEERRRGDGRPGGRRRGGGPRREVQNVHRFEADALNRDRDVIGKIYGRRVEGFGTVITKTEWFDQTGQPAPEEQKPE